MATMYRRQGKRVEKAVKDAMEFKEVGLGNSKKWVSSSQSLICRDHNPTKIEIIERIAKRKMKREREREAGTYSVFGGGV
ncbi:uncharacterized protein G2W53_032397 [Senna tora]|uniref:Uncharacterized protein n=1 Tax=Senna tora TaxID=362788 RepID=A0A834SXA0_9FABA|nr:uncharacterized protein G2W53_032397 [Senna tora]